jgi:hypothetical protein
MANFNLLFLTLFFHYACAFKYLLYNPIKAPSHVMFGNKMATALRDAGHTVIQYSAVQTHDFNLKKLGHKDDWIRWPKNVPVVEAFNSRLAVEMWEADGLSLQELIRVSLSSMSIRILNCLFC